MLQKLSLQTSSAYCAKCNFASCQFTAAYFDIFPLCRRATLEESAADLGTRFPGLADLRWRVDVTISTSDAKRVMQPSILMQMALANGEQYTFDMPVAQFHKLRYNVAKVRMQCTCAAAAHKQHGACFADAT